MGSLQIRYKGVTCYTKTYKGKSRNYIAAQIQVNGKNQRLGQFKTAIEAARAYDKKAIEIHGNFACLNFITN